MIGNSSKHPFSGFISLGTSSISLIIVLTSALLGIQRSGTAHSMLVGFVILGKSLAVIGIISGLIGLRHPRKILPIIGFLIGGSVFVIFAVIIISLWDQP